MRIFPVRRSWSYRHGRGKEDPDLLSLVQHNADACQEVHAAVRGEDRRFLCAGDIYMAVYVAVGPILMLAEARYDR